MRARQLSFLPKPETQHGGSHRKGKRKLRRPFDPKCPLHVSLRSVKGSRSLLRFELKWRVHELLQKISERHRVRVYRFANVGNHLHMLVQARARADFQAFLREFAGAIAVMATGAAKGRPRKFWDGLAWSLVVRWGRQFRHVARYILLNVLEPSGLRDRRLLAKLVEEGIVFLGPEPEY